MQVRSSGPLSPGLVLGEGVQLRPVNSLVLYRELTKDAPARSRLKGGERTMAVRALGLLALLIAAPAEAGKPFDVHGLIIGDEGARYLKGVPTLDLQQQRGAVQLRSLGFYNNRPVFAVAIFNGGQEPVNIGLEDIHVVAAGSPLRVFSVEELERQAKRKAWWSKFGTALLGGLSAGLAANQRSTYRGTISGPYGTYSVHASYPSLAGQLQADRIQANTMWSVAAIQYQLDQTIAMVNNHVVQRTTVDPGASYAGLVVLDKLKTGKPPFEIRLDVDWNGERYPFAYLIQKPGRPVPEPYSGMLAANAKPRALSTRFAAPLKAQEAGAQSANANVDEVEGAIYLRSGAVKIPAETSSGYCLKTPPRYVGTGSVDYPAISGGLPRCKAAAD